MSTTNNSIQLWEVTCRDEVTRYWVQTDDETLKNFLEMTLKSPGVSQVVTYAFPNLKTTITMTDSHADMHIDVIEPRDFPDCDDTYVILKKNAVMTHYVGIVKNVVPAHVARTRAWSNGYDNGYVDGTHDARDAADGKYPAHDNR